MTQLERMKTMTVEEVAQAIYDGISSDPCDYCCECATECPGSKCTQRHPVDIIAEWLKSEVKGAPENMQSICTQAVNSFGDAPQMLVAIEEMAELTQALSKSGRYGIEAARAQVLEEMADVYIMLEQLKIIFDFSAEEVQREQAVKLGKLKKYLGSEKK